MALWFTLCDNAESLGMVEVRCREWLDLSDPAAIADVWSTYDVYRDWELVGQVRHQYGRGPWRLLMLAVAAILHDSEKDDAVDDLHVSQSAKAIATAAREVVANDIRALPRELGDEGWKDLAGRAAAAGYPPDRMLSRRRRFDFTTFAIEAAYRYGLQRATEAAAGRPEEVES